MIVAVADTGPLLHLHEAGAFDLLPKIATVSIPRLVEQELRALLATEIPDWIQIRGLSHVAVARSDSWQQAGLIHPAEADALTLAMEISSDWFLTDEAAARLLAESSGVEVHGSLGIVLYAASVRIIAPSRAREMLNALSRSSLWISNRVYRKAMEALEEIERRA